MSITPALKTPLTMLSDEEFDSVGFTFIWKIENFSYCLEKKDSCIKSPNFVMISSVGETAWHLQIYPRGKGDYDFIGYNLRKERYHGTNCIRLDYQLSILASDGSLEESIECERGWFHQGSTCIEEKFIAQDELFGKKKDYYLPQDTLTLHCRMWESNKVRSWLGQGFARTRIGIERRSVIWRIEKFGALQLAQDNTFVVAPSMNEELSLRLYLTKATDCDKNIQIDIFEMDTSQENLTCAKIAILNSKECLDFLTISNHWFEEKEEIQIWHFPISILKSQLLANKSLYLPNDILSIQCDCVLSIGNVYSELENIELGPYLFPHVNYFIPEVRKNRLSKENGANVSDSLKTDLLNFYIEKTLCDFELRVGAEALPVHKTVLCARSPVFHGMLSNDMIEKKSNVVDISDLDCDTVKRMLHFMYTDSIEDLEWDDTSKLYFAADKYGIESLKQKCSSFLVSNLCTTNVCEALELGDLHQDDVLKTSAMKFVLCNDDKILLSDEWIQLLKSKGQLAAEVMHWMYLKKIGK